jgi:ubiquinone/menaquinone biosynthesis C-methylase UbiE
VRVLTKLGFAGAGALLAAGLWWRKHPSACPYGQRFWVEAPRPFITRQRLREALVPEPGETVLEIGPGTGYYSLDVAERIAPGTLHIFDLQKEMLDHTMTRARERDITNIEPRLGDARSLPYEDETFDAAYLVATLGEIPDQDEALAQLRRVLKPGGRLVVGELFFDPHMVGAGALRERGTRAGFRFDAQVGPRFGYFARLVAEAKVERPARGPEL